MLTALRRITKSKSHSNVQNKSAGLQTMSQNLQKKFSQGVQYNMKIIIKGDTCCGKTSLFQRLQGKSIGEYSPTEEIQVANVQWNYKNAEDVVKVEVWDIVDKGKKRPVLTGLKFTEVTVSLDAEFLDVYKGTDGVVIVFDITKAWTFNYVQRELPKIPEDIPVLILGNCCDMGHHRAVPEDTVRHYVDSVQRPNGQAQVRYTESSMVNGFGLRYVYKFFALPFLQLQRKTLKRQMDRNAEEIQIALDEIDMFGMGPYSDYRAFLNALSQKRRKNAESVGVSLKTCGPLAAQTPSVIFGLGHPINRYRPFAKAAVQSQRVDPKTPRGTELTEKVLASTKQQVKSVEEFVPDGEHLDDQFFRETPSLKEDLSRSPEQSDSESEEAINPLVADFQEDIDPEDRYFGGRIPSGLYFNMDGSNQVRESLDGSNQVRENLDFGGDCHNLSTFEHDPEHGCVSCEQMVGPCIDCIVGRRNNKCQASAMHIYAEKGIQSTVVENRAAGSELNKPLVSERRERVRKLKSGDVTDYDELKMGLKGTGEGLEEVPTNIQSLSVNSRKKSRSSARHKKGKSDGEKRLKDPSSDPTDGSKTKKHKKVKDEDRFRSKKKMKSREQLLSDSLKDLEEFFAF